MEKRLRVSTPEQKKLIRAESEYTVGRIGGHLAQGQCCPCYDYACKRGCTFEDRSVKCCHMCENLESTNCLNN